MWNIALYYMIADGDVVVYALIKYKSHTLLHESLAFCSLAYWRDYVITFHFDRIGGALARSSVSRLV